MMEPTATTAAGLDLGQPFDTTRPLLQSAVMVNLAPGVYYGDALPDDASNISGPGYTVLQQVPYDSASYQNDQQSPSAAYSMLGPGQSRSSSSSLNGLDGVVLVESLHCGPSGTVGSGGEWRASAGEFQPNAGACNYTGEMSLQEYHEEQAVFIDQTGLVLPTRLNTIFTVFNSLFSDFNTKILTKIYHNLGIPTFDTISRCTVEN